MEWLGFRAHNAHVTRSIEDTLAADPPERRKEKKRCARALTLCLVPVQDWKALKEQGKVLTSDTAERDKDSERLGSEGLVAAGDAQLSKPSVQRCFDCGRIIGSHAHATSDT